MRQPAAGCPRAQRGNDDFITQGTEALRSHPRDLAQQFEAREKTLLAKVGEPERSGDRLHAVQPAGWR